MNVKQRIRMTASEIAMGRYMRAPDHPPADDEFSRAFAAEVLVGEGGNGGDGGDGDGAGGAAPAAGAGGDGAGAPAGDGAGAAAGGEGQGDGAAAPSGDGGAAPAAGGETPAASPPADDKGAKGAAAGEGGTGGDGAGGDAGDAPASGDGGAAGKAGSKPAAVPPAGDTDAILDRLAEAVANRGQPKAGEAPAAGSGTPAAERPPMFNEAETAVLAKFKEDWPQEAQAVELMQRELGAGIIQYVFDQIAPAVKEIKEVTDALSQLTGSDLVTAGLGDYPSDEEIDQIKDWVKTQPAYLQAGMNGVIDGGTPDDVVDLVSRYREATGRKPAGAQEPPKPQGDVELSGTAKQAAEALAPVDSKRSAVQSPEDATNFDASWAKWAEMDV